MTLYGTDSDVILHIVKWYWDFKGENHEFLWIDRYIDHNQWNTSEKHCCWASFFLSYFSFLLFLLISNFVSLVCNKNWEEGEDLRETQLLKKCRDFYPKSSWSTLFFCKTLYFLIFVLTKRWCFLLTFTTWPYIALYEKSELWLLVIFSVIQSWKTLAILFSCVMTYYSINTYKILIHLFNPWPLCKVENVLISNTDWQQG